ncbi:MAG TPA: pinensin family lanthipeptide [Longimicrobium sp.]|nr:pinensin family lanthipeptide [Longimicrobium sp.]
MNRKKLSLDDLRIDSFITDLSSAKFGSTIDDPGSTAPPVCNSVQTCVC